MSLGFCVFILFRASVRASVEDMEVDIGETQLVLNSNKNVFLFFHNQLIAHGHIHAFCLRFGC